MAPKVPAIIGKTLYGFLFVVILPLLLIVWSERAVVQVRPPGPGWWVIGVILIIGGAMLTVAGTVALMLHGKGLPMNAYPPARYVSQGIYKLISHPIYAGFSILWIGFAVVADSASGLWLVSPILILSCVALVHGFERHDLEKRFGPEIVGPLIRLPEDQATPPTLTDRLAVYILVVVPWVILYEAVRWIGSPADAVVPALAFENNLKVYEWTESIYASTYIFTLSAPLRAPTKRDLREAAISGLIGTALIILIFLTVPFVAPPRSFVASGYLGKALTWERAIDTPAAAFPSFHVFWALIAARLFAARMRSWKILPWSWAALISLSCITTGMHLLADVLAGLLVFWLVVRRRTLWQRLRKLTERIANSWREWRVGRTRIINHGLYAGAAAFVGMIIIGTLMGPGQLGAILIVAAAAVVGSAIWAQLVEGSSSLLRPFGWYGGLVGAISGALLTTALGADPWLMLGAFAVACPWIQSLGRLRCLVQGCCHGRQTSTTIGIVYLHPRSRVCRLTSLGNVPVHPTPLYSILANLVIAIIELRLWQVRASLSLIVGVYLILGGLARFVEESYRGEPQTVIVAGLRIYQWLAVVSVLAGVFVTMVRNTQNAPRCNLNWESVLAAGVFGLLAWFAFGVDFPNSNRRFSRLA